MAFVTFGEIMLRLTPKTVHEKLMSANGFSVDYAGAESNVASSLAQLGNTSYFVTKLPNNPLGNGAMQSLKKTGISTEYIIQGGQRIGIYFIEKGASVRPSRVVYDRSASAISQISKHELDWESILKDKSWLHLTGITPALSEQCTHQCILASKTAAQMGVKVSFDMNFRRSLWKDKAIARDSFDKILEHTTILFANLGALKDVYDIDCIGNNLMDKTEKALYKAHELFHINEMAFSVREHVSASTNTISGIHMSKKNISKSREYTIGVVDRFGTGDAFAAAFLHAYNKEWNEQETIDFATAAFALKHTIPGDVNYSNEEEIHSISHGNISGHVIR